MHLSIKFTNNFFVLNEYLIYKHLEKRVVFSMGEKDKSIIETQNKYQKISL